MITKIFVEVTTDDGKCKATLGLDYDLSEKQGSQLKDIAQLIEDTRYLLAFKEANTLKPMPEVLVKDFRELFPNEAINCNEETK